jgi:ABC-type multidrug transport system ATPase subunit
VYGEALSAPGGIDRIRAKTGVCPQFDILWAELTGREHMLLYGSIKVRLPSGFN